MLQKIFINAGDKGYHFKFICNNSGKCFEVITGKRRYGNLGAFTCPNCETDYYATIDDHQNPHLYVAINGEQPSSIFDEVGRKRSIEIKMMV